MELLQKQVARLSVPEVAETDVKEIAFLGEGGFKSAYLCEWQGIRVVQLKLRKVIL